VGIAPLKFLAKIASDIDKPDGLTYIAQEDVSDFISKLPVVKVSGVGKQTSRELEYLGIKTLGDIRGYSEQQIIQRLGKYGKRLYELASGIDRSGVRPYRPAKSISSEETLPEDTLDKNLLKRYLLKHSEDVGRELRLEGVKASTVTLKIKFLDFSQKTRQIKLDQYTDSSEIIYRTAARLFDAFSLNKKVRLIGVGASDFSRKNRPVQLNLFDQRADNSEKWGKIDRAVDAISEKFGRDAVKKAELKNNNYE
jgi:DNA polymerase-4